MDLCLDFSKKLKEFDLEVSLKLSSGNMGILGASGCGKSMTLKCIAGIQTPDRGKIQIGEDLLFDSEKKIDKKPKDRRVGYLFQNYALFPNMTVRQNIEIGLKNFERGRRSRFLKNNSSLEPSKKVERLIERFHLQGLEDRYPMSLSGGQQQRVAFARILAYEPGVLLLDEPFSAMDSYLREELRLELGRVLKEYEGFAVMVTHDRDEAYQLCEYTALMDQGRVIGFGKTKELFKRPGNMTSARLTGCKNLSRAEKINDYRVRALDWGLEFKTKERVPDTLKGVGIRAHDFLPVFEEKREDHFTYLEMVQPKVTELPFEWYVTFAGGEGGNSPLLWKIAKGQENGMGEGRKFPSRLKVEAGSVMLFTE